jgi:hypothetical protein
MADVLEVLEEVGGAPNLRLLHPIKLDRWHRGLLGLPDAVYMQYGCEPLLRHVQTAATALRALVDLLGADGLPLEPQELARRQVGRFRWFLTHAERQAPVAFELEWSKDSSSWHLTCPDDPGTTKTVPDLETALEKSREWSAQLTSDEDDQDS